MKELSSRRRHQLSRAARIGAVTALTFVLPAYVSGQALPSQGDRVRISRVDGTVETGIFQSASAQGVQLRPVLGSTRPVISLDEIELMERNLGRHGRFGRNFGITVAASTLGFVAMGAIFGGPCDTCELDWTRGETMLMSAGAGFGIGLLIGVIVGSAVKYERWETLLVSGADHAAISIHPIVGRRIGFSSSFALGGH